MNKKDKRHFINSPIDKLEHVPNDKIFSRMTIIEELGIAPMTFDKYFKNDSILKKLNLSYDKIGKRTIFTGKKINVVIDFLKRNPEFIVTNM